ncbi:MAG TPA: AMP-binding protein, partial [Xanthobacteraceae bacterium]|nr:AMP-binding protein [Xanthobacteraceae bacterium]
MADLGRLLLGGFARFGDRPALNDANGTVTYRGLADMAVAIERALREAGLVANEPVLLPVANEARDAAALIGVWLAGGVAVPIARHAPASAIDAVRAATGARLCVINAIDKLVDRIADKAPPDRPLLDGAALVVFTSGSTGRPKGVVLSHRAFVGKLEAIDSVLDFTPRTRTLLVLQITFVFGMWVLLLTLLKGGTAWMQARFEPLGALAALKDQRISEVALVPTMLRKFLALDEKLSAP